MPVRPIPSLVLPGILTHEVEPRQETREQTACCRAYGAGMDTTQTDEPTLTQIHDPTLRKPLRVWPGVVAAVLVLLVRFVVPVDAHEAGIFGLAATFFGVIGGVDVALAIFVC